MDWQNITVPERSRTYLFPQGTLKVDNVVRICVRSSGTHRLECADGKKYIVPTGWMGIIVDADEWSF